MSVVGSKLLDGKPQNGLICVFHVGSCSYCHSASKFHNRFAEHGDFRDFCHQQNSMVRWPDSGPWTPMLLPGWHPASHVNGCIVCLPLSRTKGKGQRSAGTKHFVLVIRPTCSGCFRCPTILILRLNKICVWIVICMSVSTPVLKILYYHKPVLSRIFVKLMIFAH